jgi:hypothetical protein
MGGCSPCEFVLTAFCHGSNCCQACRGRGQAIFRGPRNSRKTNWPRCLCSQQRYPERPLARLLSQGQVLQNPIGVGLGAGARAHEHGEDESHEPSTVETQFEIGGTSRRRDFRGSRAERPPSRLETSVQASWPCAQALVESEARATMGSGKADAAIIARPAWLPEFRR